jgi:hypothetical protein
MTVNRRLIAHILTLFIPIVFCTRLCAQNNLMKEVSLGDIKQQRIGVVLDKIASKGNFYFAYNNKTIPADSLVSVSGYRGTLFSLLDKLLGDSYEFKEVPGYIVLRHAPAKLYLTAEVDKDQAVVKGHVNDASSKKEVAQASVYEKNQLVSTLTDNKGYFELKLKNREGSLLITVSKENYRDTSLYVLPVVNVDGKHTNTYYKYYPDDGSENGVEHSRFARFFISSKQLIQGLNLGNFFTSSPYQISLIPGLSSHGMYNSQIIDHFSLNLLGGYTAGVNGFEAAGIFNINKKDMAFFQAAGVFNVVGGSTTGFQIAGIYNNVLNNAVGLQVAGVVNRTRNFTAGMQAAGIVNITQNFAGGMQLAGLTNITGKASGFQVAGLFNKTKSFNGVQFAGLFNTTQNAKGLQLAGLLNHSAVETGPQIAGLVNVAKKVKGIQLALLANVADTSDYPIGLFNFIKNGEKSFTISTDEALFTHLDFRSGGQVLYSILGFGYKFNNDQLKYAIDFGLGAYIVNRTHFSLANEYVSQVNTDFKKKFPQVYSIKVLPGYKPNKHLRLFAGPSINFALGHLSDIEEIPGWVINKHINGNELNAFYVGLTGGLQFVW